MQEKSVLIIGLGSIAAKHINALKALRPGMRIYALRSSKNGREADGVTSIYSWTEMPADIGCCLICSPTFLHTADIRECVQRNIPFMLEKPVSDKLDGLEALNEAILQQKLKTYVACNLRFLACLQYLKNALQQQGLRINEVNVYCGSYLPEWRPGRNFREIYSADEQKGGGVHLDLFHELDYTIWLFGFPFQYSNFISSRSSLHIQAADYANYRLCYTEFTVNLTLNYYRIKARRTIEIVLENDVWEVDVLLNRITNASGTILFSTDTRMIDTYTEQMAYFMDYLDGKALAMNTFSDSLNILKICLDYDKLK